MSNIKQTDIGAILSLWRYPVKSMMGEELNAVQLTEHGLSGDRAYALLDNTDGKTATAKNPRKWPNLFAFRAALTETSDSIAEPGPVRITLPDGTVVTSDQKNVSQILSEALNREVTLGVVKQGRVAGVHASLPDSWAGSAEEYRPDIEEIASGHRDTVADFTLPAGTFFDAATVHLLTTATIDRLRELYPQGRFEVRRFRSNIVIAAGDEKGFVESNWVGRTLTIGNEVRLSISGPCPRCVMTTLPQGDLPKDHGILRTAAQHNQGHVGVYAVVVQGGTVRCGDQVKLYS